MLTLVWRCWADPRLPTYLCRHPRAKLWPEQHHKMEKHCMIVYLFYWQHLWQTWDNQNYVEPCQPGTSCQKQPEQSNTKLWLVNYIHIYNTELWLASVVITELLLVSIVNTELWLAIVIYTERWLVNAVITELWLVNIVMRGWVRGWRSNYPGEAASEQQYCRAEQWTHQSNWLQQSEKCSNWSNKLWLMRHTSKHWLW